MGQRAPTSLKKIISSVEEILETIEGHITRLRQQKILLQEKLDTIRNLDENILTVVSEGRIDGEICEADELVKFAQLAIVRIDAALTTSQLASSCNLQSHLVLMASETHQSKSFQITWKCLDGLKNTSMSFQITWKFLGGFENTSKSF